MTAYSHRLTNTAAAPLSRHACVSLVYWELSASVSVCNVHCLCAGITLVTTIRILICTKTQTHTSFSGSVSPTSLLAPGHKAPLLMRTQIKNTLTAHWFKSIWAYPNLPRTVFEVSLTSPDPLPEPDTALSPAAAHTTQQPVVPSTPPIHILPKGKDAAAGRGYTEDASTHIKTHLLSLCIIKTNELIDVQQGQRCRQSFPLSEAKQEKMKRPKCKCVCVCVPGFVLFFFCLTASELAEVKTKQWSKANHAEACRSSCIEAGLSLAYQCRQTIMRRVSHSL